MLDNDVLPYLQLRSIADIETWELLGVLMRCLTVIVANLT